MKNVFLDCLTGFYNLASVKFFCLVSWVGEQLPNHQAMQTYDMIKFFATRTTTSKNTLNYYFSIAKYSKKVPLKTSTLLSLKQHCLTIFLYAKSEQYAERSSRVEDIYVFPVINMMKDSLQNGPAYHFCPKMVNLISLFISMFWLRTVDLHEVMMLIFPCWMFNFMLFILVLGTTALWLQYLQEHCWWFFVCTEKIIKRKI